MHAELRKRRLALGLTQAEIAELAGVSERFVRAVEAGKTSVHWDKLMALAEALGLEVRFGLRGTDA